MLFSSGDEATVVIKLQFQIDASNHLNIYEAHGTGTGASVGGSTNVCDGKWHHVVGNSDGSGWSIILDGNIEELSVLVGANNGGWFASTPTTRDNVMIGARQDSGGVGYPITGEIGYTRVYSRPMLQPEALTNYQRGRKAPASDATGLVFNLPTTEGTGNPVDTVGSLTMTVTGATWIESLMDKSPNALPASCFGATWGSQGRIFGSADKISIPKHDATDFGAGSFSVEWWANYAAPTDFRFFMGCGISGATGWGICRIGGSLYLYLQNTESGATLPLSAGSFYHGVFTISRVGDQCATTSYKNGAPVNNGLKTYSGSVTTSAATSFWSSASSQWDAAGIGGEVRLYNRALTPLEIQRNYLATKWRYL